MQDHDIVLGTRVEPWPPKWPFRSGTVRAASLTTAIPVPRKLEGCLRDGRTGGLGVGGSLCH